MNKNPIPTRPTAADSAASETRQQQRQALRREECARRGVRFLPEQVMRPIYERAGLN